MKEIGDANLKSTHPNLEGVNSVHSKLPIFRVKSVKIYTWQFFFTQAPPVVPVTNMRYGGTVLG